MSDSIEGQLCVVTGATRGIGLAAAEGLAARGGQLVLVGRDPARLDAARAAVAQRAPVGRAPVTILADLSTKAGVELLIDALARRGDAIDVLLNNAGAIYPTMERTADGIERTFALNHLAPFHLTLGVLPLLRAARAARVVTVSSEAHRAALRNVDDWQSEKRYTPMLAYARSKLANILFTRELARRLQGTPITANCFHPGVVRTEFAGGTRGLLSLVFRAYRPFMRTSAQGAETGVWLATSPDVAGISGHYFIDERERKPSSAALDPVLAGELWAVSETLIPAGTALKVGKDFADTRTE